MSIGELISTARASRPITWGAPGPMPGTPEWDRIRSRVIGASEAAAACGLSEYRTPLHVFCRKRGLLDEQPDTPGMRLGRKLEPVIVSEYEHRMGLTVEYPVSMSLHPENRFIAATPDGRVTAARGLECKSTNWRQSKKLGEEGTDYVFPDWVIQCQQCMYVTGAAVWDLVALIDGRDVRIFTIKRNDRLIAGVVSAVTELWERIQNNDPPEANWTHPRTPELIKELHAVETGREIQLGERVGFAWEFSQAIGKRAKRLERMRESLRAYVLESMGDAAIGVLPGGARRIKRTLVNKPAFQSPAVSYVLATEGDYQPAAIEGPAASKRRKGSTASIRKMLLLLSDRCRWCGKQLTLRTSTLEHVVPLAHDGADEPNNWALACRPCNETRADSGLEPKYLPKPEK